MIYKSTLQTFVRTAICQVAVPGQTAGTRHQRRSAPLQARSAASCPPRSQSPAPPASQERENWRVGSTSDASPPAELCQSPRPSELCPQYPGRRQSPLPCGATTATPPRSSWSPSLWEGPQEQQPGQRELLHPGGGRRWAPRLPAVPLQGQGPGRATRGTHGRLQAKWKLGPSVRRAELSLQTRDKTQCRLRPQQERDCCGSQSATDRTPRAMATCR